MNELSVEDIFRKHENVLQYLYLYCHDQCVIM